MRRLVPLLAVLVILAASAATTEAATPEETVAGANKAWFSGTNVQQWGTNCSILGQAAPEPMVSSTSFYGGANGVPAVNEQYWMGVLVSIPGNPCGTGIAAVITDVIMPANTTVDPSRRIRCFATRRFASSFEEVTDQTFSFAGSTGDYCPDAAGSSTHANAINFGWRLLANGQMFEILVPVKTTAAIDGTAVKWLIDGTGVYSDEQPGVTGVWTTIVASTLGSTPTILFTREAARPYWDKAKPAGTENRVEFFMSLYTAGRGGELTFELLDSAGAVAANSAGVATWNKTVTAGALNVLQLAATGDALGPNKGYVPWTFTRGGDTFRIRWKFVVTSVTPNVTYTRTSDPFRILPGPDSDGDGVADIEDACPTVNGPAANGCPRTLATETAPAAAPDDDSDGVQNSADKCPSVSGKGDASGCPAPTGRTTAPKSTTRAQAISGLAVSFTCDTNATVRLRLLVDKPNQAKLGLKPSKTPVAIASASSSCKTGKKGGVAKLRVAGKYAKRIGASNGRATVTLEITMIGTGNATRTTTRKMTLT